MTPLAIAREEDRRANEDIKMTRFTHADADRAYEEWGANCGPGAIAAIMNMTLDEVRPHMGDFEAKKYTNPTLMQDVLRSIGRRFSNIGRNWPNYGLVRIQWEGPWTEPGVPMRARYRYTHWIGTKLASQNNRGVFDINCINNGTGWVSVADWSSEIVPWLLEQYPRATGSWHVTHGIEVSL